MNILASSSYQPEETEIHPEKTRHVRARLRILPLIAVAILLLFPPASGLTGTDTLIWSANITADENFPGYYEFSGFFTLDEDRIVWKNIWSERKYNEPLRTDTLYLMNITTGTTRVIARAPDAGHPWSFFPPFSLSRDLVVYTELGSNNLFLFNISEEREYPLTQDGSLESLDETRGNGNPSMDGDRIVWSKRKPYSKGYDYDIVMQNLTTGEFREICTAKGDQVDPRIAGTTVVWTDRRDEAGSRGGDIYLYDLASETESPVCTVQDLQQQPDVFGDAIVWSDYRDGNPAIYKYDLKTKSESRISSPSTRAYKPLVDGNVIAWSEYSLSDTRDNPVRWIVLYDLETGTREPVNATVSSYGLDDLDDGRILYSTGSGDAPLEKGYIHLYVIDMPRKGASPKIPGISPEPGLQVPDMTGTSLPEDGQAPAGQPPSTRPAPGFAAGVAAIALTICGVTFRVRRNRNR
jgi:beta propeller repeat protein